MDERARPADVASHGLPTGRGDKKKTLTGNKLIRRFHTLQKDLSAAVRAGDTSTASAIEKELATLGGLDAYQQASIAGQDRRRGGDSSKVLVDWLKTGCFDHDHQHHQHDRTKLRVLEIGCLSTDNYISRLPNVALTRIDLNSQHPLIQQQDFLQRPPPASEEETFDGISCSLVLNFVPVAQRGDFMLHLARFLPAPASPSLMSADGGEPKRWLFFVLPAPCVTNSRYVSPTPARQHISNAELTRPVLADDARTPLQHVCRSRFRQGL